MGKIFIIIVGVHVLLKIIKAMGWIHPLIKLLSPVLKLLGLSEKAGTLWIAGAFFGLIYGSAVILEEMKEGLLTDEEVEKLHLSIGINHSFIEDPILFMALGVSFFWAWVPPYTGRHPLCPSAQPLAKVSTKIFSHPLSRDIPPEAQRPSRPSAKFPPFSQETSAE